MFHYDYIKEYELIVLLVHQIKNYFFFIFFYKVKKIMRYLISFLFTSRSILSIVANTLHFSSLYF